MVDYMYDEYGGKKFDLLIPIAIIVIVAIIFLGKTTTMLCGVPVVGSFLCPGGQEVRIAVLGAFEGVAGADVTVTAPEMKKWLDGEYGAIYNMYYVEYPPESIKFLGDQLLAEYDLVVLVGDREYKRPVKDAVEDYLAKGGKVLLIGDAALEDPDDPVAVGWGKMGMPVRLKSYVEAPDGIPTINFGTFTIQIATMHHPILEVFEGMVRIQSEKFASQNNCMAGEFVQVDPKGARTVAFLSGESEGEEKYLPAIVETDSALGGKVVYFAFDPGCSVNMMISTVEYLSGKDL